MAELITKEKASLLFAAVLKDEISRFSNDLVSIDIKDNDSLEIVKAKSTALNKVVNKVDAERKRLKEPYLKAGKVIDEIAKEVIGNAPEVIEKSKKAIADYIDEVTNEALVKEQALREQEEKRLKEIEDEKYSFRKKLDDLKEFCENAGEKMQSCKTMDDLKVVYLKIIADFPDIDSFGEYKEVALLAKNQLIALKDELKNSLNIGKPGKATTKVNIDEIADEVIAKSNENAQEQIQETVLQTSIDLAQNNVDHITSGAKTIKWNYELVDFNKVPLSWLQVNPDAVEEYIIANKANLKDGFVVNGIKFIAERKVRLG